MQRNKQSAQERTRRAMRDASSLPQPSLVDLDPEDPSQLLDDAGQFSVIDINLNLDAEPHAEADAELDAAVATSAGETSEEGGLENDEELLARTIDNEDASRELDTPESTTADDYAEAADDTGDLYGVRVPRAADAGDGITPDGESFEDAELGEHVFETLEKRMAESGTEDPEEDVELEDDSDPRGGHNKTDTRDRPIADKGSGGPGGL